MFKVCLEKEHISAKNTCFSCQKHAGVFCLDPLPRLKWSQTVVRGHLGVSPQRGRSCVHVKMMSLPMWSVLIAGSSACRTGIEHIAAVLVPGEGLHQGPTSDSVRFHKLHLTFLRRHHVNFPSILLSIHLSRVCWQHSDQSSSALKSPQKL